MASSQLGVTIDMRLKGHRNIKLKRAVLVAPKIRLKDTVATTKLRIASIHLAVESV